MKTNPTIRVVITVLIVVTMPLWVVPVGLYLMVSSIHETIWWKG